MLSKDSWILVTGGAGLIGSTIVYELNQMGYENIVIVDHLGTGEKWQNLRALKFVDYFEKANFYQDVAGKLSRYPVKVVFHLGNCSDTTEVDATYLMGNNYDGGKELTDYCLVNDIRMIYASSAATYGDGDVGFLDDETLIPKLRPLNKYGYSKQIFDQYLWRNGFLGKIDGSNASFVGVKYSNVFGPNEYHKGKMRSMFLRCYEQITAGGQVGLFKSYRPEYGDGEQVRDFLYVRDAARMTIFFMNEGAKCTGLYNIGFGATRSWNDLAKAMFFAMGKPVNIKYIDMPEELKARYQYYTCLDISKIRQAGYTAPLTSLEDAAKDYVSYLKRGAHWGD
ncbi:MAG: ADP-glyceromanno-heptose 6-epimerase [Lentisphaeria bacterium]|nr:ADP-glyceromanno-heptose 6-epimerase [Lentisphaeria bacterium]